MNAFLFTCMFWWLCEYILSSAAQDGWNDPPAVRAGQRKKKVFICMMLILINGKQYNESRHLCVLYSCQRTTLHLLRSPHRWWASLRRLLCRRTESRCRPEPLRSPTYRSEVILFSPSDVLVWSECLILPVCVLVFTAASRRASGAEGDTCWTHDHQDHLQQPGAALSAGRRRPGNTNTAGRLHTEKLANSNLIGRLHATFWNRCTGLYLSTTEQKSFFQHNISFSILTWLIWWWILHR